ncbi:MAG: tripartite tricarboxylate transporter substrate binding protein [Desulfobacteraceae bacterium]|nr:tripartite tricarboxylate transporter substrate binding protein [Desulfobacteraceae bacterium]
MRNKIIMAFIAICLAFSVIWSPTPAMAAKKGFPQKMITWIVPYNPGGGFDTYSRALARVIPKYLPNKVKIIIKNIPGAGSRRGASALYRSRPDGYTIGILNFPGLAAAALVKKTEFDLAKYVYVGRITISPYCLSVPKKSPYRTLEDLKQAKKPVRFPTTGKGATGDLTTRIANAVLKIPTQLISGYKTAPAGIVGTIRGDSDAVITGGLETHLTFIESGDLSPILVFLPKRSKYLPNVPTAMELGYDGELSRLAMHRLVAAPPGTPKEVIDILSKAMKASLEDEGLVKWSKETKRPLEWASGEESREIVIKFTKMLKQFKKVIAD